ACISEFMANNQHGLQDEDGDCSGWIELTTSGATALSLSGWFLTDSPTNLTQWRFPKISLLPEKYLIVFASGKNRVVDPVHLHTNFRLSKQGGYLALVDRSTNIVSEFNGYPEQAADASFGRVPGEWTIVGRFPHPTPGKPNATHGVGF